MNQQYLFNVKYYENLVNKPGTVGYDSNNRRIIEAKYSQGNEEMPFCEQSLAFEVLYPGILTGNGYTHEAGFASEDKNDEIKTGFSLDYVSGLPYIPGSTVKGVLRSDFSRHRAYVEELLGCDGNTIDELKEAIFENGNDVFLDAFPVKADEDSKLLGLEYITPHKASDPRFDGLTGINPIRMLKIRPGVTLLFRFLLGDTTIQTGGQSIKISADTKLQLFERLLGEYGIGAKTNLGVGQIRTASFSEKHYFWLIENGKSESISNKVKTQNSTPKTDDSNVLGICPICKKSIKIGNSGKPYHDKNCNFRFKKYYKTELSNDQIRDLLAGKEITVYDNLVNHEIRVKQCGTKLIKSKNTGDEFYCFDFRKV